MLFLNFLSKPFHISSSLLVKSIINVALSIVLELGRATVLVIPLMVLPILAYGVFIFFKKIIISSKKLLFVDEVNTCARENIFNTFFFITINALSELSS